MQGLIVFLSVARLVTIVAMTLLILWVGEPDIHDQFIAWMETW